MVSANVLLKKKQKCFN